MFAYKSYWSFSHLTKKNFHDELPCFPHPSYGKAYDQQFPYSKLHKTFFFYYAVILLGFYYLTQFWNVIGKLYELFSECYRKESFLYNLCIKVWGLKDMKKKSLFGFIFFDTWTENARYNKKTCRKFFFSGKPEKTLEIELQGRTFKNKKSREEKRLQGFKIYFYVPSNHFS